jgi:iron complex outermembrane receptor protein
MSQRIGVAQRRAKGSARRARGRHVFLLLAASLWFPAATAAQETTKQASPPADATPPQAPAAGTAGTSDELLPTVEIIQEAPKPPPKVAEKKPAPKKKTAATAPPPAQPGQIPQTAQTLVSQTLVRMSPVGGSELPIEKVPGGVSTVSSSDLARDGSGIIENALESRVPGIIVTDLQGNEFQTNIQYRGFESSPLNGVPQGLAVYQNGVRINEAFGDIVNWDFLPAIAIDNIAVMSGNPVFGLNALGGAVVVGMKDGFGFQGAEVDVRAGSFGREQVAAQAGLHSGPAAVYLAFEDINDDGWRDFSPSKIKRLYADLGFKGDGSEFHINFTGADNFVGAVTAAPVELLDLGWNRTYTSPQTTDNKVAMVSANSTVKASQTLSFSGVTYYRHFKQDHIDANILDAEACDVNDPNSPLCIEGEEAEGEGPGVNNDGTIRFDIADPLASIDNTSQDAKSFGGTLQAVDKSKLLGRPNQFLIGASYDHGRVEYAASSELGEIGPLFVVSGLGIHLTGPDDVSPRSLITTNDYYGLYLSDTLDVTDEFSLTFGGRYNVAQLTLEDQTGQDPFLNGSHTYSRFNPVVGGTYRLSPGLSFYGSYSEANRAPTPAELACADPDNPCLIESFLTGDPPLKQVVSHTWEGGLRGQMASWGNQRVDWSLGLFRALNVDDIISVAAPTSGRGYFKNAGDTLRQGVEASVSYRAKDVFVYANYSYVDATFASPLVLPSPSNPSATVCPDAPDPNDPDAPMCIQVEPGDTLPGVPKHKFKAGFDYWITQRWKLGADLIASSSQVFYGDEANLNSRLAGYAQVNLHSSFDLNEHVQVYGLINNLFEARFGTFGNYFDTQAASDASLGTIAFADPRTVVPSQPFAAYGGIKVRY